MTAGQQALSKLKLGESPPRFLCTLTRPIAQCTAELEKAGRAIRPAGAEVKNSSAEGASVRNTCALVSHEIRFQTAAGQAVGDGRPSVNACKPELPSQSFGLCLSVAKQTPNPSPDKGHRKPSANLGSGPKFLGSSRTEVARCISPGSSLLPENPRQGLPAERRGGGGWVCTEKGPRLPGAVSAYWGCF